MLRVAIVGGGASGMMCAYLLAKRGAAVTVYEKEARVLRKLLATGNGRCNFTNASMDISYYTGGSGYRIQSVLDAFDAEVAKDAFLALGVPSKTLESGMVYPHTMSAKTVQSALESACEREDVEVVTGAHVTRILQKDDNAFRIYFEEGKPQTFDRVVLATGGAFGIAKGSRSNGHDLATGLGHDVTPLHPGIAALEVRERALCKRLAGMKVFARLDVYEGDHLRLARSYEDDLLFTDTGISGIATLKASNTCLDILQAGLPCAVDVDFYPEQTQDELVSVIEGVAQKNPTLSVVSLIEGMMPQQIAKVLVHQVGVKPKDLVGELGRKKTQRIVEQIKKWSFHVVGVRSGDLGQVTCGGVDLHDVSMETLESKLIKGLYFTGEVLDVQGECGGYNLHWAWASAHAVKRAIFESSC